MLYTHVSELAIAEWGAGQSEEVKKALGFENGVTPHQTTIQRLFRKLSGEELEAAFRGIFGHLFEQNKEERGACAVAIDGKAQKGRLKFEEEESYPVHAVSIVEHETGIVLTQGHVERKDTETKSKPPDEAAEGKSPDKKTDQEAESKPPDKKTGKKSEQKGGKKEDEQEEKKQRSELAVAYRQLLQIDWKGKVLTGDAFYCQRCLCAALLLAGGDYLFLVKGNQPQLFEDLRLLFAPPSPAKRAGEGILRLPEQEAQTTGKGHGRLEIRSIRVSSELKGYSDWPGLEQVCEIRRRWQSQGEWHEEVRYAVSSLPAMVAIPERLLKLKRGHVSHRKSLALRQRCEHGRRSKYHSSRQWTQNHGHFAQYRGELAPPGWGFSHRCSSALQLWPSPSCFARLVSLFLRTHKPWISGGLACVVATLIIAACVPGLLRVKVK